MRRAEEQTVTLVGAGLVGSLLAAFLARRGYQVEVYERRPDMRKETISAGRSINLAVSLRGLYALKQLGLEEEALRRAIPMRGRMMHAVDGKLTFQRYGRDDSECINSVSRGELNQLLMTYAENTGAQGGGKAALHFNQRAVAADLREGTVTFKDERSGAVNVVSAPIVIGTDGSASVVRDELMKLHGKRASEEILSSGYKELVIPAGPGGKFQLEKNALHIWPRGTYMLIALPNRDGSFTCTLFLPMEGPLSFATLKQPAQVRAFFKDQFSDALALMPDLEEAFFHNPTGHMVTVKCEPWHCAGRALLLGDAAHAIVPFFGQGMNCGFEDVSIFDELLARGDSLEQAFAAISAGRKPHADAIADMAVENFAEMRDKVADPRFLLEKAVERVLMAHFPDQYVSRYALVTFSREPYGFAYKMGLIQNEILAELCNGLEQPEKVDLERARKLIAAKLAPHVNQRGQPKRSDNGS